MESSICGICGLIVPPGTFMHDCAGNGAHFLDSIKRLRSSKEAAERERDEAQADRERIYGIAMAWQARAEGAEADCVSLRGALEEHRTRHLQEGGVHHCIDGLPFCETCPQARGRHCSCCRFLADTAALQSPHSGKAILEKEGKKQ